MRFLLQSRRQTAFTLVEVMVAGALFAMVGGIAYFITSAGAVLYAKNYSINASGSALRGSLDRINAEVSQSTDLPLFVTISGSGTFTTSTTATTPAAGIIFDKFLGGPYIMQGTATATATSFTMTRSTNSLVVAPVPLADDIVAIDGSPIRSRVSSASTGTITSQLQPLTVTLKSGSKTGIAWVATEEKPASLLRKVAFIVVGNELRYYPMMEGVTNYLTASYAVITRDIGNGTGEATPFSSVTKNGRPFLSMSFRVQNQDTNKVLANKESKEVNTSLRIDTLIRPRNATY